MLPLSCYIKKVSPNGSFRRSPPIEHPRAPTHHIHASILHSSLQYQPQPPSQSRYSLLQGAEANIKRSLWAPFPNASAAFFPPPDRSQCFSSSTSDIRNRIMPRSLMRQSLCSLSFLLRCRGRRCLLGQRSLPTKDKRNLPRYRPSPLHRRLHIVEEI